MNKLAFGFLITIACISFHASADDSCATTPVDRRCTIGHASSSGNDLIVGSGTITVTRTTFAQNELSTKKCNQIGAVDIHAELRIDGDEQVQVIGLAAALGSNGDVTEDESTNTYKLINFRTEGNSGLDFDGVTPFIIPAKGSSNQNVSFVLDGHAIALPITCN